MAQQSHLAIRWVLAVISVVAVISAFSLRSESVFGQTGNGLRITPVRQELTLTPGQNDSYTIEVTNVTAGPTTVQTFVNDFESDNESGQPTLIVNTEDATPYSVRNFVTVPEDFALAPGESKEVTIFVNISENTAPGGYYGAVRFLAGTGIEDTDSAVALSASVASLVLVNVPGETSEGLTLEFISAARKSDRGRFFETAPDNIITRLNNTGNTILKPFGRVAVKDWFGNVVFEYEFNGGQQRNNILPKTSRSFSDEISNIGFIGRFTVEANLSYGEGGGNIITANSTFWVLPWKVLLAVLIIVVLIVWFATRGIKMYNRKIVEKAKKNTQ